MNQLSGVCTTRRGRATAKLLGLVAAMMGAFTASPALATFGACCDDVTNTCAQELEADCAAMGLRFGGVGSLCAEMDPPCDCTPSDCDDGLACTTDVCEPDGDICIHTPDDELCDNGDYCDGPEFCDPEVGCSAGAAVDCSDLDSDCLLGVCDEGIDDCVTQPSNENGPCDDGLFCTVGETCAGGVCGSGVERICDDGNACTTDACDEQSDMCVAEPVSAGSACGDAVPRGDCDNADVCDGDGNCTENYEPAATLCRESVDECDVDEFCTGDSVDCPADEPAAVDTPCTDDGEVCTDDVCDGLSFSCTHPPAAAGTPCTDDGEVCTDDVCDGLSDSCTHPDNGLCGACCDRTPGRGGVCVDDVLQEACVAGPQDDLVWTQGATCDEVICEEASGACCEAVDGACQNNVLRADCSGSQQTWHKDQSCGAVTCELALGACCDPAVMALRGTCTDDMQRVECLACESGECTWFKRESCAEVAAAKGCIANPIPTVSEWGLVILTLLLLTAAKVYFGYRPQPC